MIVSHELGISFFFFGKESSLKENTEVFATFLCYFTQPIGKCCGFLLNVVKPLWEAFPLLDYDYSAWLGKEHPNDRGML